MACPIPPLARVSTLGPVVRRLTSKGIRRHCPIRKAHPINDDRRCMEIAASYKYSNTFPAWGNSSCPLTHTLQRYPSTSHHYHSMRLGVSDSCMDFRAVDGHLSSNHLALTCYMLWIMDKCGSHHQPAHVPLKQTFGGISGGFNFQTLIWQLLARWPIFVA